MSPCHVYIQSTDSDRIATAHRCRLNLQLCFGKTDDQDSGVKPPHSTPYRSRSVADTARCANGPLGFPSPSSPTGKQPPGTGSPDDPICVAALALRGRGGRQRNHQSLTHTELLRRSARRSANRGAASSFSAVRVTRSARSPLTLLRGLTSPASTSTCWTSVRVARCGESRHGPQPTRVLCGRPTPRHREQLRKAIARCVSSLARDVKAHHPSPVPALKVSHFPLVEL